MHKPSVHWSLPVQRSGLGRVGTQTPAAHHSVAGQSVSLLQPPAQRAPLQAAGKHDTSIGAGQRPVPIQETANVATDAAQLASPHASLAPG
jgi:hypothetical protein